MSRYIDPPSTVREDLGDGDWVEIRKGILWREMLDAFSDDELTTSQGRTGRAMEGIIRIGVVTWGGAGFDALPFGPEAIARLRPNDAARIAQLVGKFNPDLVSTNDSPKAVTASETAASDISASSSPAEES